MAEPPVPADAAPVPVAVAAGGATGGVWWLACWVGIAGVLVFFFGVVRLFQGGTASVAEWSWAAWNPLNHQEHAKFLIPIVGFLLWWHRGRLRAAPKRPDNLGLVPLGAGIACYLLSVRAAQPRLALLALPFLLWGGTLFLWGSGVARVCRFPFALLVLLVPVGSYVQGTVSLQLLVTSACNLLAPLIGLQIEATGTTIRSLDGAFHFEIAEGCSGIRSLMAMVTVTALYVHFAQPVVWRKAAVLAGSLLFALVGNIARIFSVLVVARIASPQWAAGLYHDYSDLVFFPVAVAAMAGFNKLLIPRQSADTPPPQAPLAQDSGAGGRSSGRYDY